MENVKKCIGVKTQRIAVKIMKMALCPFENNGSSSAMAKNAIEMPAHQTQLNMTTLNINAISACPLGILATISHSLIARGLTQAFSVDRADQHGHLSLARQH